ncbi:ExeM/NucH family extracellular endonuclease [Janibacter sp. G1551]|uniref:ExeM/NucH family extracellular endonuclease n=1 Tax=Janibacter sp. G1551 TaxID=3420440 RepID=UPI003CFE0CD7
MSVRSLGRRGPIGLALGTTAALALTGVVALPANAAATHVIITEAYGGAGNSGATLTNDFVELNNPTGAPISLDGYTVQYFSASGNLGNTCSLTGTSIAAGSSFLIQQAKGTGGTQPLPTPDAVCTAAMSGSAGTVALVKDGVTVDLVGWGSSTTKFEGAPAAGTSSTTSVARKSLDDSDNNAADFAVGAPTPVASGGTGGGDDEEAATKATIAEIQGTGTASPLAGKVVETTGVVTANYPTGGFNGFYLQTPGSGGATDATPGASDGVFVYGTTDVTIGDCYTVTGTVKEFSSLTELADVTLTPATDCAPVAPVELAAVPSTTEKEALEGQLVQPVGTHTITNNYSLNQFGTLGLTPGDKPLYQATDVVTPGPEAVAYEAANKAKEILLDDGARWNYMTNATAQDSPLPWLSQDEPMRTGSQVTFAKPVVLDYRFGWNYQPTGQIVGATDSDDPLVTENDREETVPAVGGDVRLASFNVLNYFTDLGIDENEFKHCDYFADRDGNPVATDFCEVRGAWTDAAFADQKAKLITAVNSLDSGIVALSEIENSAGLTWINHERDYALAEFVGELNAAGGNWAYAASPVVNADNEDVIRTAYIYNPDLVKTKGASTILLDEAFANARYPLAQDWQARNSATKFTTITNHFKSKGSGENDGTGQGNSNPSREAQARALTTWVDQNWADEAVFLTGDFNAYAKETPVQIIEAGGFTNIVKEFEPESASYQFSGRLGSLDHIFVNDKAKALVTGAGIWDINGDESIAMQYSRRNYNVTDFYTTSAFASSDHDPAVAGINVDGAWWDTQR